MFRLIWVFAGRKGHFVVFDMLRLIYVSPMFPDYTIDPLDHALRDTEQYAYLHVFDFIQLHILIIYQDPWWANKTTFYSFWSLTGALTA